MAAPTYPGVYIREIPSGVRPIVGVATSIAAFVGRARRGPVDEPVRVQSFGEFERNFGRLWTESTMSYAVQQFFANGGRDAVIVRIQNGGTAATAELDGSLTLAAASPGAWANALRVIVDHDTADPDNEDLFNMRVEELRDGDPIGEETFLNVSVDVDSPRLVTRVLEQRSRWVRVQSVTGRPAAATVNFSDDGADGNDLTGAQFRGSESQKTGIFALENTDLFNLLCLPPPTQTADHDAATWTAALNYCESRRAMLLVDPPSGWSDAAQAQAGVAGPPVSTLLHQNAAIFFPRIRARDPERDNSVQTFVPSGVMAGVFARTDAERGVWKAPAGIEASLRGVLELAVRLTDGENGRLNPLGINCLRSFPVIGNVAWGSRTLRGADRLASEWKYVPVRRMALFLEETLYRGLQWVVFEPNAEPLWAQIRLNVGSFMQGLFRQGAFQGTTPHEAYLVKCDRETTTQDDIDKGIVNILVGFAPLRPAEFVVVRIQQLAGQAQA